MGINRNKGLAPSGDLWQQLGNSIPSGLRTSNCHSSLSGLGAWQFEAWRLHSQEAE